MISTSCVEFSFRRPRFPSDQAIKFLGPHLARGIPGKVLVMTIDNSSNSDFLQELVAEAGGAGRALEPKAES
jgi:hypothetical protein